MDIKRLNPWNWFSHEENQGRNVPVQRHASSSHHALTQLHRDIDRIFGNVFPGVGWGRMFEYEDSLLRPRVDVVSGRAVARAEVPGRNDRISSCRWFSGARERGSARESRRER